MSVLWTHTMKYGIFPNKYHHHTLLDDFREEGKAIEKMLEKYSKDAIL